MKLKHGSSGNVEQSFGARRKLCLPDAVRDIRKLENVTSARSFHKDILASHNLGDAHIYAFPEIIVNRPITVTSQTLEANFLWTR